MTPLAPAGGGWCEGAGRGLLQDHVGVDSAEVERVHRGPPGGRCSPISQGRARSRVRKRVAARPGWGSSQWRVGSGVRWWRASAALTRPAAPAAGMVWPIIDFTDPSTGRPVSRSSPCRPEDLGERGEFGRVPGGRGGAVRLQQADRVRCGGVESGGPPGLAQGAGLAARVGRDGSAVRPSPATPVPRITAYTVAVACGVREAFRV